MRGLLALMALIPLGCGRADYDRQAEYTRQRLLNVDEENALLGPPIAGFRQPTVFFRLPVEIDPRPAGALGSDGWLRRYAGFPTAPFVSPLDAYVGALQRTLRRQELEAELIQTLRERVSSLRPLSEAAREVVFAREAEPMGERRQVKYRRLVFEGEAPLANSGSLPHAARRLEVFVHDAGEWWLVIVIDHLDRDRTERRWRREEGFNAAWLRRLPALDVDRLARQQTLALATLRVGADADAAWRHYPDWSRE